MSLTFERGLTDCPTCDGGKKVCGTCDGRRKIEIVNGVPCLVAPPAEEVWLFQRDIRQITGEMLHYIERNLGRAQTEANRLDRECKLLAAEKRGVEATNIVAFAKLRATKGELEDTQIIFAIVVFLMALGHAAWWIGGV